MATNNGTASDDKQYNIALKYEANVRVLHEGGQVASDDHGGITFTKCDAITILLTAGTNRSGSSPRLDRSSASRTRVEATGRCSGTALFGTSGRALPRHGKLFNRMTLDLGKSPDEVTKATTDQRLRRYNPDQPDHGLEELVFQYARYLLISTSRRGTLPANLQGKWNDSNQPVWRCDYHSDVNTQMELLVRRPGETSPSALSRSRNGFFNPRSPAAPRLSTI